MTRPDAPNLPPPPQKNPNPPKRSPRRPAAPSRAGRATATTMASADAAPDASFNKADRRRMLHAVFRVGNQPASAKFFTEALGMRETRFRDVPEGKYSNGFYAYGPETKNFALETTYNYGVESYDVGEGFGHFGVATKDVAELAERIRAAGGTVRNSSDAGLAESKTPSSSSSFFRPPIPQGPRIRGRWLVPLRPLSPHEQKPTPKPIPPKKRTTQIIKKKDHARAWAR